VEEGWKRKKEKRPKKGNRKKMRRLETWHQLLDDGQTRNEKLRI